LSKLCLIAVQLVLAACRAEERMGDLRVSNKVLDWLPQLCLIAIQLVLATCRATQRYAPQQQDAVKVYNCKLCFSEQ
jgi:hypothetical protein